MSFSSDQSYRMIVLSITLIAFPIALLIFAFSSCEVRKRSEKAACRAGDVEKCLYVGKYYEDKDDGIIGFAMSNADTAIANYYQACKLKSPVGCERMMHLWAHSDQAKNLSTDPADMVDALIDACSARVTGACGQLWDYMGISQDPNDWSANRSAAAFDVRCTANNGEACYRLGLMHVQKLGGQHDVAEQEVRLFDKACASGIQEACREAEQARPTPRAPVGSGADATTPSVPAQ